MGLLARIREHSKIMDISKAQAKQYLEEMGEKARSPMGIGAIVLGIGAIAGTIVGIRYFRKSRGISKKAVEFHKKETKKGNRLADTAAVLASLSTAAGLLGRYLRR